MQRYLSRVVKVCISQVLINKCVDTLRLDPSYIVLHYARLISYCYSGTTNYCFPSYILNGDFFTHLASIVNRIGHPYYMYVGQSEVDVCQGLLYTFAAVPAVGLAHNLLNYHTILCVMSIIL